MAETSPLLPLNGTLLAMMAPSDLPSPSAMPDLGITNNSSSNNNNNSSGSSSNNASWLWAAGEAFSVSQRARAVLSQPVAVLALALCLLSLLANSLSITATLLGPNGLVTHLKLVVSLCLSDMLLGLSELSDLLNRIFNPVPSMGTPPEERLAFACVTTFHFALKTMAIVLSLLNLLVMALDHYVAIMNPLHYPTRLSRTNGNVIVCVIWVVAFLGGCSVFVADLSKFRKISFFMNYCEYVRVTDYQGEYLIFAVAFLTLFVIVYTYGRIYLEVRRTYRNGFTNRLDYARNRKALLTTLLIIGTFVFCWLPACLYQIAMLIQVRVNVERVNQSYATFLLVNRYLNALLLLNCLCDPVIYAFRLRDVQLGYRKLFQKCFLRRHDQYSSFRSSMIRKTQIVHLPAVDTGHHHHQHHHHQHHHQQQQQQANSSGQVSPPCNSLSHGFEDGQESDVAEVTPMIVYSSSPRGSTVRSSGLVNAAPMGEGGGGERGGGEGGRRTGGDTLKSDVNSECEVNGKLLANVLCRSCDVGSCLPEKMSTV